jgi:glycine cleavage system H protein
MPIEEKPMPETRFTKDHEWVRRDGAIFTVGITNHAQAALGDLVFIELPEPGRSVEAGEACAVVESVKAASDVFAPMSGTIAAVNGAIIEDPALVNRAAESEGWFFQLTPASPEAFEDLLDATAYRVLLETP